MLLGDGSLASNGFDLFHFSHNVAILVTLWIVILYHVLHMTYDFFHYPRWLVHVFEHKERNRIRRILGEVGFNESWKDSFRAADTHRRLVSVGRHHDYVERCMELLRRYAMKGEFDVGFGATAPFPYYIDLMSASVDLNVAGECADVLTSFLRFNRREDVADCDVVVGIKQGSPQIASTLATRLHKPAAFFRGRDDYKYNKDRDSTKGALFDGAALNDLKVLIVDDSTTGGRKVLDCVEALRSLGCKVNYCLVLFEPLGKDARKRLSAANIELVAVVTLDSETLTKAGLG